MNSLHLMLVISRSSACTVDANNNKSAAEMPDLRVTKIPQCVVREFSQSYIMDGYRTNNRPVASHHYPDNGNWQGGSYNNHCRRFLVLMAPGGPLGFESNVNLYQLLLKGPEIRRGDLCRH